MNFLGYLRPDGLVGIRNKILIISVDECCEGIARNIAKENNDTVILTNSYTCMLGGNEETFNQLIAVGENPNVCGVIVIAMGCGSILTSQVANPLKITGKPVYEITCQKNGGTRKTVEQGIEYLKEIVEYSSKLTKQEFPMSRLVIGAKCGGSDTSSGIASNPSVGTALDKMVDLGATCIGGELFELIGCENVLSKRAKNPQVANKIVTLIDNEKKRWGVSGVNVETMSIGNSVGGLTTIEEKSLGALHKMGTKTIQDVLQINSETVEKPTTNGFYLSEVTMLCGGAGTNFASFGCHIVLWTSGAAGFSNPIVPVIRVSGNTQLYNDDMDIDARGIMEGTCGVEQVASNIVEEIGLVASGKLTSIEDFGNATMTLYQKDKRVEKLLNLSCK